MFTTLQETVKELELWHFQVLKMGQNLHANMEGFRRAVHICDRILENLPSTHK